MEDMRMVNIKFFSLITALITGRWWRTVFMEISFIQFNISNRIIYKTHRFTVDIFFENQQLMLWNYIFELFWIAKWQQWSTYVCTWSTWRSSLPVTKLVSETAATEREVNSELPAKTVGEREVTVRPHSLLRRAAQPDRMTSNERGSLLRAVLSRPLPF